jgi:DNA-binding transcriptional regulator YdaS (Cro superfamily)
MAEDPPTDTGIERAIALAGGQSALARKLTALAEDNPEWSPASQQLVSWWKARGYAPTDRAPQISQAVQGLVPARELIDPKLLDVVGV